MRLFLMLVAALVFNVRASACAWRLNPFAPAAAGDWAPYINDREGSLVEWNFVSPAGQSVLKKSISVLESVGPFQGKPAVFTYSTETTMPDGTVHKSNSRVTYEKSRMLVWVEAATSGGGVDRWIDGDPAPGIGVTWNHFATPTTSFRWEYVDAYTAHTGRTYKKVWRQVCETRDDKGAVNSKTEFYYAPKEGAIEYKQSLVTDGPVTFMGYRVR